MARRKRGLTRRLVLHAGLMIDAVCKVLFDPRRPHQRVFVDAGGMYSFHDWHRPSPQCACETRVMRLEAEMVYVREELKAAKAKKAQRNRYHKFHVSRMRLR